MDNFMECDEDDGDEAWNEKFLRGGGDLPDNRGRPSETAARENLEPMASKPASKPAKKPPSRSAAAEKAPSRASRPSAENKAGGKPKSKPKSTKTS
jgi:hypothetical protein